MVKITQIWSCPECDMQTNYRGSCRDCSDKESNIWIHRVRINADGTTYEKKLPSQDPAIDSAQLRAAFKAGRAKQKKTRKQMAAMKAQQEAELDALKAAQAAQKGAEGSVCSCDPNCGCASADEIVFGVSEEE